MGLLYKNPQLFKVQSQDLPGLCGMHVYQFHLINGEEVEKYSVRFVYILGRVQAFQMDGPNDINIFLAMK